MLNFRVVDSGVDHNTSGRFALAGGRRPTILQVLPALSVGGVERGTVDVAAAIVAAGGEAVVASSGGPLVREIERVGGRHVTLPLDRKNPFAIRANARRLAEVIEAHGIHLVHARSRAPAWSAQAAARRTGRPFLTTFHGTYGHANWAKRRYNAVMANADRVIAISHFIAEHVNGVYGTPAERIRLIPRGIDFRRFDPDAMTAERMIEVGRHWRLPDGEPIVMLPARLSRWKGHAVLVDALSLLRGREFHGLIVGATDSRDGFRGELERLIVERGLAGRVHIVDECRDMPAAYMLADVVVAPSTQPEAFGRVPVEAQAMGRPVIATDHGGARETVIDGETGLLVPPGDAAALASAIHDALSLGPGERDALARRAIAHVRRNFDQRTMCARTLAVYEELLAATRVGADHPLAA